MLRKLLLKIVGRAGASEDPSGFSLTFDLVLVKDEPFVDDEPSVDDEPLADAAPEDDDRSAIEKLLPIEDDEIPSPQRRYIEIPC